MFRIRTEASILRSRPGQYVTRPLHENKTLHLWIARMRQIYRQPHAHAPRNMQVDIHHPRKASGFNGRNFRQAIVAFIFEDCVGLLVCGVPAMNFAALLKCPLSNKIIIKIVGG